MCEKIRAIRLSAHAGESIFIYRRVQELDFRERKLVEIRLTATKIIIMLTLNHAIEASGYPHSQGGASEMRAVSNTCWDARLSGTVAGSEQDLRFRMHPSGHAT